mgnify:CR=1 FL=1
MRTYNDLPTTLPTEDPCECDKCDAVRKARKDHSCHTLPLKVWLVSGPKSHEKVMSHFHHLLVAAHCAEEALSVHPLTDESWWSEEFGGEPAWFDRSDSFAWSTWHQPHMLTATLVGNAVEGQKALQILLRT